jgi:hypothetical protein
LLPDFATRIAALAAADEIALSAAPAATTASDRLDVLRRISARQDAARALEDGSQLGAEAFGNAWKGQVSDWRGLAQAAHWIASNHDIRMLASRVTDRVALGGTLRLVEDGQTSLVREMEEILLSLQATTVGLFGHDPLEAVPLADLTARIAEWQTQGEQLSKWVAYRERARPGDGPDVPGAAPPGRSPGARGCDPLLPDGLLRGPAR